VAKTDFTPLILAGAGIAAIYLLRKPIEGVGSTIESVGGGIGSAVEGVGSGIGTLGQETGETFKAYTDLFQSVLGRIQKNFESWQDSKTLRPQLPPARDITELRSRALTQQILRKSDLPIGSTVGDTISVIDVFPLGGSRTNIPQKIFTGELQPRNGMLIDTTKRISRVPTYTIPVYAGETKTLQQSTPALLSKATPQPQTKGRTIYAQPTKKLTSLSSYRAPRSAIIRGGSLR